MVHWLENFAHVALHAQKFKGGREERIRGHVAKGEVGEGGKRTDHFAKFGNVPVGQAHDLGEIRASCKFSQEAQTQIVCIGVASDEESVDNLAPKMRDLTQKSEVVDGRSGIKKDGVPHFFRKELVEAQ